MNGGGEAYFWTLNGSVEILCYEDVQILLTHFGVTSNSNDGNDPKFFTMADALTSARTIAVLLPEMVMANSLLLKIAIEIDDVPIENGDLNHSYVNVYIVYQRVALDCHSRMLSRDVRTPDPCYLYL